MNLTLSNQFLTTVCKPFVFDGTVDVEDLVVSMVELMQSKKGIGLAANQVGIDTRIIVINSEPIFAMINPKIIECSEQQVYLEEGCLSFPGLLVKVKRPSSISVRFQAPDQKFYTKEFKGITARCVQHEIDHLNGILFYNKATKYHRDKGFKNWKQLKK